MDLSDIVHDVKWNPGTVIGMALTARGIMIDSSQKPIGRHEMYLVGYYGEQKLYIILKVLEVFITHKPPSMVETFLGMPYPEFVEKAKVIIDKTPDHFLQYHFDDCIKKEYFEIVAYIRDTAAERNVTLKT